MTILFPSPIFGPVKSRRLGVSLGINLLPADGKVCSFDCIYCECGLRKDHIPHQKFPPRSQVQAELRQQLQKMQALATAPDVITFAGNGEPTLHPDFAGIIDDTITLRDEYFPKAEISVLSNATQLDRQDVFDALLRVDNNIQKLDTVTPQYIRFVDQPLSPTYDVEHIISRLALFADRCIIQTMFLDGEYKGKSVNNTGDEYIQPWLTAIQRIHPSKVMIYTIERETPISTLRKATPESLDRIALQVESLGISCQVSY